MSKHWLKTWGEPAKPDPRPWAKSHWPHACILLESVGINPNDVVDDLDSTGYREILKDETGLRLVENGSVVQVGHVWPAPEFGQQVIEAMKLGRSGYENPR